MINFILQLFDLSPILAFFQSVDNPVEAVRFLGIKVLNPEDFYELLFRFSLNFIVIVVLTRFLYYKFNQRKEYFFVYLMMGVIVFLICFLLRNIQLGMGFALGLFAIFAIIRYRTDPIPIKEMTYLFVVVGVSMINALVKGKVSHAELVLANLIVLGVTWYLERIWMRKGTSELIVNYEKIELIHPDRREELMADLKERTGLDIIKISILRMSFLRDTARLRLFYRINTKIKK